MKAFLLTFVALAGAVAAPSDVQVKIHDGRMAIEAVNVSLPAVIDRVASRTGMKVIYDGTPPEQVIKVSLTERSTADAVLGVLEGPGVNFALILNPPGTPGQTPPVRP